MLPWHQHHLHMATAYIAGLELIKRPGWHATCQTIASLCLSCCKQHNCSCSSLHREYGSGKLCTKLPESLLKARPVATVTAFSSRCAACCRLLSVLHNAATIADVAQKNCSIVCQVSQCLSCHWGLLAIRNLPQLCIKVLCIE